MSHGNARINFYINVGWARSATWTPVSKLDYAILVLPQPAAVYAWQHPRFYTLATGRTRIAIIQTTSEEIFTKRGDPTKMTRRAATRLLSDAKTARLMVRYQDLHCHRTGTVAALALHHAHAHSRYWTSSAYLQSHSSPTVVPFTAKCRSSHT